MLCEYRYPYGSSYIETGCLAARFSGDRLVAESVFMDHPRPGADDPGDLRAHAGRARWGPAADGPDAAVDFAGFADSMRVQTELWAQHGGQPSYRGAWLELAGTDPFFRDLLPAMETSVIRPRFSGWNDLQSRAGNLVNRWLADDERTVGDLDAGLHRRWESAPVRR